MNTYLDTTGNRCEGMDALIDQVNTIDLTEIQEQLAEARIDAFKLEEDFFFSWSVYRDVGREYHSISYAKKAMNSNDPRCKLAMTHFSINTTAYGNDKFFDAFHAGTVAARKAKKLLESAKCSDRLQEVLKRIDEARDEFVRWTEQVEELHEGVDFLQASPQYASQQRGYPSQLDDDDMPSRPRIFNQASRQKWSLRLEGIGS